MKRKIAAIFAADVAGYSRLVAEDEEETLRRLASYRAVMDDFIARAGGRIFNTAGDAVLAEFSSAVEAVRCAIDIQESLRTRNLAYPQSRQMSFRIGITVGDVVERDGDLLGDGVNIAARLEGIAPVGGICISRSVHEQVANKLSVQFADIGEQQVKNIPNPVHAYKIEMRADESRLDAVAMPAAKSGAPSKTPSWMLPGAIAAASLAALAIAGVGYLALVRSAPQPVVTASPNPPASPPQAAPAFPPGPAAPSEAASHQAPLAVRETLVPETIPFIPDRVRAVIRNEYLTAADHKALAISSGPIGISTAQADDDTAKTAALELCQQRADASPQPRKCELYAVGDTVVYARGRPPLPPSPWVVHDPASERPLVVADLPMLRDAGKANVANNYLPARGPKAIALGPQGGFIEYYNQQSTDEAIRRSLEVCGSNAGTPCMIIAADNNFVVPVPVTMKATGFFHAGAAAVLAPELRDDVTRRLGNAHGWTAVAVGADGKVGLALNAANEPAAIDAAKADCDRQDRGCHVIAIGPFTVEPK